MDKINHFYAVYKKYLPNSAVSNRMLSFGNAWSKADVKVTLVFLLPDRNFSRVPITSSNIDIIYLWDKIPGRNYYIHLLFYTLNIRRLLRRLNEGDKVYEYGDPYLLSKLSEKKYIEVFHERTEHPKAYALGKWPYKVTYNHYLDCCKRSKGLFVISSFLKSFFIKEGVDKNKVHIINMTVDVSRFINVKKEAVKAKYIAYCGKASNNKDGVDQLIKAFALVSPDYPDLYLYIIGQAPNKEEKNNNSELAIRLGIADKVVFTGVVPFQEMPQMLKDATMLALDRPYSLQAEYGFPTKLGEYLLTGNPVVVTSVGDIPKFLQNGHNAMIAEPGNPEDFASKIKWLLSNPNEAKAIGERGRTIAKINFNSQTEGDKILNVIFHT